MENHIITGSVLFFALFFVLTSVLQIISKKTSFPFTVAILIAGFLSQIIVHALHLEVAFALTPDHIYYILLPILLFESAMHINFHQFRMQFWTITFISTFGLLISLFVVGFGLATLLGLPLGVSLLFGALISATDPIAVLSIFKSLGAPKRLALLADGESMFNDATAVLAFKFVAAFIFSSTYFQGTTLFLSFGNFIYGFFGSLVFGAILGYFCSDIIRRIKNDPIVESSIILTLALSSFILSDHFLGLSGVITTVMAAIVFGNFGKTRISSGVNLFVNDTWEYLAFLAVSLVFFFAAFQLDVMLLVADWARLLIVIIVVLIARAISVYSSYFLSNTLRFFKNEPDVPLSWQHIINWGGLRGVIPLVLAYSLPNDFVYKQDIIAFTLASFVFTLLINALTIKVLLQKLGLHLPQKEEEIIKQELEIFSIEQKREHLKDLPSREFYTKVVSLADKQLNEEELAFKENLLSLASEKELVNSLMLQAIEISRTRLMRSYQRGYISESVFYEYDAQLNLQQDAIEYPEVYSGRGYTKGGRLPNEELFRTRLKTLRQFIINFPILRSYLGQQEKDLISERLMTLKTKIICVDDVLEYLSKVKKIFENNKQGLKAVREVEEEYLGRKKEYESSLENVKQSFPEIVEDYQANLMKSILGNI